MKSLPHDKTSVTKTIYAQVVQVDPNTIQGQNQPITFHLQPMEDQPGATGPVRDIRDTIQGFPAPAPGQQQAWHQVSRDSIKATHQL